MLSIVGSIYVSKFKNGQVPIRLNTMGRRTGSPNRGYFYRSGRGWYATVGKRMVPLRDDDDNHLRDKNSPVSKLKSAYRKIIAQPDEIVNSHTPQEDGFVQCAVTVEDVCKAYLEKVKSDGAEKTHRDREQTIWDFCTGFPPWVGKIKDETERLKAMTPANRIHGGYGKIPALKLLPLHIDQWLASHKEWNGGKRTRIQAVKRAMNYGVECGLVPNPPGSPLKGYKVPRAIPRITYITPEQEAAILEIVNPAFAMALRVCIRTGSRPGSEFAKVEAKKIKDHGHRMEWYIPVRDHKTGKLTGKFKIIRIVDPTIMTIVREQMDKYPNGPIFRNTRGGPWTRKNLELSFRKAKVKVQALNGIQFDDDACMYSCRHTYAKRTLQGYWTGKQTNIETLARLMSINPQTCRDHYLQWTTTYEEPLWECA